MTTDEDVPHLWYRGSRNAAITEAEFEDLREHDRLIRRTEPGAGPDLFLARRYGRETLYEGDPQWMK